MWSFPIERHTQTISVSFYWVYPEFRLWIGKSTKTIIFGLLLTTFRGQMGKKLKMAQSLNQTSMPS